MFTSNVAIKFFLFICYPELIDYTHVKKINALIHQIQKTKKKIMHILLDKGLNIIKEKLGGII